MEGPRTETPPIEYGPILLTAALIQKNPAFDSYGGRGINICERWRNSFSAFLGDMGARPSKTHSIDRINNDLGYSPENCRWATHIQQANNKRNNRKFEHDGMTLGVAEWSRITGINIGTLYFRLNDLGWSVSKSLTTPARQRRVAVINA